MALRDLVTFNTAVDGIQQTIQNISSIRAARQQLEEKKKLDDLNIQQKKLNIESQAMKNDMTGMEQNFLQSQLKELEKVSKAEHTAVSGKIDIAEMTEKEKASQLGTIAKSSANSLNENDMATLMGLGGVQNEQSDYSPIAGRLNPNLPKVSYRKNIGPFTISSGKKASDKTNKTLGAIQSGGVFSNGEIQEFGDRRTAEAYANQNLGIGWKKKYPQAIELMNTNYGPDPEEFKREIKSNNIKTLRQAHVYLMNEKGMSAEGAKAWLEEHN